MGLMKQTRFRIGLCTVLAFLALLLTLLVLLPTSETTAVAALATDSDTAAPRYLLTARDGYIGVYDLRCDPPQLVTATDIPVNNLPSRDQAALEIGIQAQSREELLSLLEDFGS